MKKNKLTIAFVLGMFLVSLISAQSIGISPQKQNVDVQRYENFQYSIIVGNGAEIEEIISISPEQDYPWMEISEYNFVVEPKSQKSILVNIKTSRVGEYSARIKFCARDYSSVSGSGLNSEVCTYHTLKANSFENSKISKKLSHSFLFWVLLIIALLFGGREIAKKI